MMLTAPSMNMSCVSSNVGSDEYSRVSLPDSVVDAPPLIDMLLAEARIFLQEFQSRMLLLPEEAAVSQEFGGEFFGTTIRDCCAVRGHMLVLSVRR